MSIDSPELVSHSYNTRVSHYYYGNLPAISMVDPDETRLNVSILLAASGDLLYLVETVDHAFPTRNKTEFHGK